jgi:four helix bundle protein
MPNQGQSPNARERFDLEERTARFGENMVRFAGQLRKTTISLPLIDQLVRSSTSIGANYMEADGAESKKDFRHKIAICRKEAKETMHWLRMVVAAEPDARAECRLLWQEAHELALTFSTIIKSCDA